MKVTILTDGITPFVVGGMQRHSCNMVRGLTDLGLEIDLYHVLPGNTEAKEVKSAFTIQQWERISAFDFPWPKNGRLPGHYVRESYQLSAQYLEQYRSRPVPDVIYAKGLMAYAFLKAKQHQQATFPPIITNAHGYEMYQRPANLRESVNRWILRPGIRYVIRQSDYVASYGGRITDILTNQLHVARERIIEVPGAIDELWLASGPFVSCTETEALKQPVRFGFLGRYERRKGIEELATVFSSLPSLDYELHLIGEIPSEKRSCFPQSTVFHGQVTDSKRICELLDQIDVLVAPSWSEGMPNVIMEAMARNSAIIATDVGAVQCLVDSSTGWLIPAGDVDALRRAVIAAARMAPKTMRQLKNNGYQRIASRFTWPVVGARLYEELRRVAKAREAFVD